MKAGIAFALLILSATPTRVAADLPTVVRSSPSFWGLNVNARQKEISLTFNQPMRPRFWDWFGRDVLSPLSNLNTTVTPDHTTFGVDVQLEPAKVYVCGLNERGISGVGFQTEKGISLPPTFLVFQTAGNIAPQDAPPHVIRSIPQHGATGLDSATVRSISITFDKAMNPKRHGLHVFENNNPVDVSRAQVAYSPDGLTFTLAYAFKPATQYRFELNDIHDIGFSGTNRVPLWPVQISFATR